MAMPELISWRQRCSQWHPRRGVNPAGHCSRPSPPAIMLRTLQRSKRPLSACLQNAISTSAVGQSSGSPAVAQSSSGGGFLSSLFGGGHARLQVPLTDPLPGVENPYLQNAPKEVPPTELSTLSNGIKVASEDTLGPTATIGLYVEAGSAWEAPHQTGVSHLMEYMAFKSTQHRSHFRLVREVEALGANVIASASREQIVYNIDAVKTNVPEALEILADSVLNPAFLNWEVRDALARLKEDLKEIEGNPQTMLLEGIHTVAYTGALAKPLVCPENSLAALSDETLHDFFTANYVAPRIVLAGSGVKHSALKQLAEPLLSGVPGGQASEPGSKYVGGDYRQYLAGPLTHFVLGFEFAGGWRNVKGACSSMVLQYLLGGGGSFSTGGPGKGMHSKIYTSLLNQHSWLHNCTAINSMYNETGLFGVFTSAESQYASKAVDAVCGVLQDVAKSVSDEELRRAKQSAINGVLMNLESRAVVSEDIGRQVLAYGKRIPVREFLTTIEKLSASDITKAASAMLKSPVSMASLGNVVDIPRYPEMQKRFS